MSALLTDAELEQLTDCKYAARQIEWLRDNGVRHLVGRSGRPKVLRAELDRILLGAVQSKPAEPDFESIDG